MSQQQTFLTACTTSWLENSWHRYGMKKFESDYIAVHLDLDWMYSTTSLSITHFTAFVISLYRLVWL